MLVLVVEEESYINEVVPEFDSNTFEYGVILTGSDLPRANIVAEAPSGLVIRALEGSDTWNLSSGVEKIIVFDQALEDGDTIIIRAIDGEVERDYELTVKGQ